MANLPQIQIDPALAQLRDIHLPKPIGFWPLAPGWYLLLFLFLLALFFAYRWYRKGQTRRHALRLLALVQRQYQDDAQPQEAAIQISDLLRRVVLAYFPRAEVASLQGRVWIAFLTKTGRGIDFEKIQALLLDLPYAKTASQAKLEPLFAAAKAWIKQRGSAGHV